jgi:Mrp family chromosome partitioning ATPase
VVTVSVGSDWTMDRSLAEPKPDADLQRLCDHIEDLPSLCNQFSAAAATECFVLGVTSRPEHRRLKARLAARLSWLFAQNEHARILLVEVDLNHPSIDGVMRIVMPPGAGFSLQLQGQLDKVDRVPPWTVVRCTPQLSVLAEGRLRTPSMAYYPHFPAALASLRPHYDVIVAHGPAIENAQTASAFEDLVDGIVFAVPPDMSESDAQAAGSKWFKSPVLAVAALRGNSPP